MTRILIVNHFGTNKGDAAILVGLVNALKERLPDGQLSVISSAPDVDGRYFHENEVKLLQRVFRMRKAKKATKGNLGVWFFQALSWVLQSTTWAVSKRLGKEIRACSDPVKRQVLQAYCDADIVVSCGGGYLTDNYGFNIIAALHDIVLAMMVRKPVFFCAQSIGPFRKPGSKVLTRLVLNRAEVITFREPTSGEFAASMGIDRARSYVTADTAFLVTPASDDRGTELLRREQIDPGKRLVGITLYSWHYPGNPNPRARHEEYKRTMAQVADFLVDQSRSTPVFVPMNIEGEAWDERPLATEIVDLMKYGEHARILKGEYTPQEIASVVGHMDYVIGTRFHSVILAFLMGVPAIAIMYEHKARGIMRMMGLEQLVCSIDSMNTEELITRVRLLENSREQILGALRKNIPVMTNLAMVNGRFVSLIVECSRRRERLGPLTVLDRFDEAEVALLRRVNQLPS